MSLIIIYFFINKWIIFICLDVFLKKWYGISNKNILYNTPSFPLPTALFGIPTGVFVDQIL